MPTFKDHNHLMNAIRARLADRARSVLITVESVVEKQRQHAIRLTSGTVSSERLRKLGHPYARRHGRARLPLLPIHKQTGQLQRSLRVFRRAKYEWRLQFTAAHSKHVLRPGGTEKMLARGFWARMNRHYREDMAQEMRRRR